MYDWLDGTLDDSSCIVTANRRLARLLQDAWAHSRVAAGETAWRTPDIQPWHAWLGSIVAAAAPQDDAPTRINAHQAQVLWDRCLRKELGDGVTGVPALARLARDAWQRLADARVGIRELARSAQSDDQRMYAAVAGRYLAVLEHEAWVDDAGLGALALSLLNDRRVSLQKRYVFAGFDSERAIIAAIKQGLVDAGCEVVNRDPSETAVSPTVYAFEQRDAELRTAGAWARGLLEHNPGARVAIVLQGLEQSAVRDLRLVRDGFVPGWQYGPTSLRDSVNVSYGKRLNEYPAVKIALLVLRWLVRELSSSEVSMLLQSPLLGDGESSARSRLELRLRQLPDRAWAPSMVTAALRGRDEATAASDWISRVAAFSKRRRELPKRASPAEWALLFDDTLSSVGWPGPGTRGSDAYQLVNRWRELLNEFARLDIVSPSMSPASATGQLEVMAGETLFQPESRQAAVQLMGPLEAGGAEFDAIWIAGLTANSWPPAGNPPVLVSRQLQRDHGMPDASPEDTRAWAESTLRRLTSAAPTVACSFSRIEDDVEQAASDLLEAVAFEAPDEDPGWHAASLAGRANVRRCADDVPTVVSEKTFGGAGTVQRQMSEPFAAFASGRLGVRVLDRQAQGVPASLRGQIVHDALYRLYQDLPSADDLRAVDAAQLGARVADAVGGAMQRHERHTDRVLGRLLALERERIEALLTAFVEIDRLRGDFEIAAVEGGLEFRHGPMRLRLRFDRIDRYPDGHVSIIDYKTGTAKKLLKRDGSVKEAQLFVYAAACGDPVASLALANIDPRETGFDGAGRGFTDEAEWPALLDRVKAAISEACDNFVAGDVRLIEKQGASDARPLNVLSRYTELRRGD